VLELANRSNIGSR